MKFLDLPFVSLCNKHYDVSPLNTTYKLLIYRPHGQHAVVLAEDAPKFMEKGDPGQNISASRQIYLTFPADSVFTEEDVSKYFNK